jgi:hypothetical protein
MTQFDFISDKILRANLDTAFEHIKELVIVAESETYANQPVQISSFRKTAIINIATIIEALLIWKIKQTHTTNKIELVDEWNYSDIKILHEVTTSKQIIGGTRTKEKKKLEKLKFIEAMRISDKEKIITNSKLLTDTDKVRRFRNRQHLGSLAQIEKKYSIKNVEFCFSVLERVIKIVSK